MKTICLIVPKIAEHLVRVIEKFKDRIEYASN
jgi:hypothetical protein